MHELQLYLQDTKEEHKLWITNWWKKYMRKNTNYNNSKHELTMRK